MGCAHGCAVLGSSSLPRTEGGSGVRGSYPDSYYSGGRLGCCQALECAARECHYPVHRCLFGGRGRRSHLYAAGHLHPAGQVPGDECRLPEDIRCVAPGRRAGHPVPDTVPALFRGVTPGAVPLPGGYGHHAGAEERRPGQQPGQAAAVCRTGRRSL